MKQEIKKKIPKYDSRTVMATVVLDPTTGKKRLRMNHQDYYQHELNQYAVNDQILLRMTNKKQKRTDAQNRYLHLYLSLISASSGHTVEELKSWAKGRFLSTGITEVFGDKTRKVKDTSRLTVSEMMEFVERIAEATGIPAPDPEPFNMPHIHEEIRDMKKQQKEEYREMETTIKM